MYDVYLYIVCGCLKNWFILCTYNLFPFQLLTKDTKYFHDLTLITIPLTQRYHTPRQAALHVQCLIRKNDKPWEFEVLIEK